MQQCLGSFVRKGVHCTPIAQHQGASVGLFRHIKAHVGAVPNPISAKTRQLQAHTHDADVHISVCPFCAVGCSQQVFTKNGTIINIEGNPASPINAGTLCPKGAATAGLMHSPARVTTVKYRAPGAEQWEDKPLAWAMERIAQLVKHTRDAHYEERDADGTTVNRTLAIGHLGGATLDNEENYLIKKLFTGGLGIVAVENQARI
jgi:formate dehydrogenase major subunit